MAKQLNVNLAFTADTHQAKAQITELYKTLNSVMAGSATSPDLFNTTKLKEGVNAAKELEKHLNAAVDINTGKLNLSAFSASLKSSGKSLADYKAKLEALGPAGENAFLQVSRSIATADAPLRKTNSLLREFSTTLKNTARWQISSSILHGFMGAVQSAYGYTQDLNESLNNIRIVTGNNVDEMAKFAKEANRAAKALSTTTTEYTNASLIYYQQGLDEQQVKERTDITIKMANVARDSAETVSDQLTAVWNNFYENGTQPLEHYADAMTALGAATASSTDEIAGGLEKFASIADMIGLSFDSAAAALATITATTRQSEEVVGTALKTIFARIQGLNLGETLDDGTDLNKYSEALSKVGISIYDAAGGLKDMDSILAEMGEKWEFLSDAQQVALAQAVAGVRQYNQLVSLMDNYDFYQQNIMTAQNSTGELDRQAEIYAESWEAAQDRVTAAAENIYDSLLDDTFFIKLTDAFGVFLEGLGGFADGFGGMEGVLSTIGGFITQKLAKEAPVALNTIKQNLMQITHQAHDIANETQQKNISWLQNESKTSMQSFNEGQGSLAYATEVQMLEHIAQQKNKLIQYQDQYSSAEKQAAEQEIAHLQTVSDALVQKGERYDKLNTETLELERTLSQMGADFAASGNTTGIDGMLVAIRDLIGQSSGLKTVSAQFKSLDVAVEDTETSTQQLAQKLSTLAKTAVKSSTGDIKTKWIQLAAELSRVKNEAGVTKERLMEVTKSSSAFKTLATDIRTSDSELKKLVDELKGIDGVSGKTLDQFIAKLKEMGVISADVPLALGNVGASLEDLQPHAATASEALVSFSGALMQANAFISSMTSLADVFTDEDATAVEKIGAAVGALTSGFMLFNSISQLTTTLMTLQTGVSQASAIALFLQAAAGNAEALATLKSTGTKGANIAATIAQTLANWGLNASMAPLLVVTLALAAAVAVLVLAITGVVAIFKAIKAASPEGQLEALKEKAERSAEAFNRVQEAVNATKEALEGLESSYEAIDKLTKGTNEWYEAITNANAEVIKLMEKYPQLASEIYTTDDGLLKITQEGIDSIQKEDRMHLQAASNANTSNQIAVKEKEIDNSFLNFKDPNWIISDSYDYSGTIASAMQQYYESAGVGDQLFTKAGSDALLEGLKEAAPELFDDEYGNERYIDPEAFYETVMANETTIRENAAKRQQINVLEDSILTSRGQAVGSNRNAQEIRDIIGEDTYSNIKEEKRADVSKAFDDWNDHINYKESNIEWDMIQDFMDLQGENVEYVAQRKGKMVLEVDGEEIEYTKDEVYNALAELYSGPDLEAKLEEGLENSLKNSLGYSVENLDLKNLTAIDNFRTGLADALAGTEYESESDSIFKSIIDQYGTSAEGIEAFQADTQYIDLTSEAFLRQAVALNEDKINAEQFASAIGELNAQGQILAMGSYFSNAAEGMGLDEEAAVEMQNYAEHLRSIAKDSDILADSLAEDADSAADLSVEIHRMNKGIEDLAEGFENWKDILKNSSKESAEYAKAMKSTKSALSDVLDIEEDLISSDFVEEHLDEIEKAASGDAEAIDSLRSQMDEEIIQKISLSKPVDIQQQIIELDNKLKSELDRINAELPDIEVGAILQDQAFLDAANNLVTQSGMTADEANAYFAGIGYEPVYNEQEIDMSSQNPNSKTLTEVTDIGWSKANVDLGLFGTHSISLPNVTTKTTSIPEDPTPAEGSMNLVSFSGESKPPEIKGLRKKATGSQNNYSSSNTGGKKPGSGSGSGGSNPKKATLTKKLDIVDRYKQVEDQLDDVTDAADDASKAMDRLYGKARINKMKEVNKLLLNEVDLLEQKKDEAKKYLDEDKKALQDSISGFDMSFTFDGKGNISNYQSIMDELYKQLSDMETGYGDEWDESEQEDIDNLKEKIDKVKEAISQYDETRELMEDIDNEIQEKIYEWQDNNYEILKYELELKIEINDAELKRLEYFLDKYSDSFYKMAESAVLMNQEINPTIQNLEDYKAHKEALDAAYAAGKISQEAYIEGLKEVREGYYENLEALNELDKQMMHYLEDTLSAASEELADFTDHMEHLTDVFDHYTNLMEILGKQKDYDAMGNFLGGKADTIRDRLNVAKEYYEMLKENSKADEYWGNYQAALAEGNDDMAAWWKEQWDAEVDALDAAQAEMLSLTEEWAEAMKAIIENNMNKIAETLEKTLTKLPGMDEGFGFDYLMDSFDKLNTRQEEYLTKTNQIYETNKLMRTASKALDETDNSVAKQKLKNFIEETKSLQENTKLSKYELEIQQAKYDLLLAEIALEEAQNAKSTVRLSRDSEGNFGYVYTADQDAISDAEQGVEDAENSLYNLSLEGQQEYTEKYLQAQQDMYNQLTELQQAWLNGEIASEEEYERRKEEILNHYLGEGGVLQTYSNLYRIACQTDSDAVADNWQTNYGDMTQDTESWKIAVDQYLEDIKVQTDAWKDVSTQANEDVEGALTDSETATKDLKDESGRLADTITSKVIPAIDKEIEAVTAQTAAYAAQREELLALIASYEDYLNKLDQEIAAAATFDANVDYSALMNEYLNQGGKVGDATYNELLAQREAKIDFLENQGYDSSYWGTRGDETTAMYNALYAGGSYTTAGGKVIGQDWYTADYVPDDQLAGIFESLGVPLGALEEAINAVKDSTDTVGEKIDASKEDNNSKLNDVNTKFDDANTKLDDANSKADDTNTKLDDSNSKADDANTKLDDANSKADDANSKADDANGKLDDANATLSDVVSTISSESGSIQSAISSAANTVASSVGGAISSIQSEISGLRSTVTGMAAGSVAGPVGTAIGGVIGSIVGKFDTGGYTGDWGPEGKLAILHQKELVLNANDTSNILSAVEMIREISSAINAQANMASLFNLMATSNVTTGNETLEQSVTIHAEFPNATDHNEIEEAFNNLVNRASQYANRK